MKHNKLLLPTFLVAASLATTLPVHADTLLKAYAAVEEAPIPKVTTTA